MRVHWPLPPLAQATHSQQAEGALPTFQSTRHDGWDGSTLGWPSAAARVGDTRGKAEWLGNECVAAAGQAEASQADMAEHI